MSVDREGDYYLSIGGEEMAVDLEELGDRVLILLERQPGTQVMVRGDRFVPYGEVVTLMSTLQVSGVTNVGLISEPPPRD